MLRLTLILAAMLVVLSACSTIEVANGPQTSAPEETYSYWHHNAALSLWEVSSPVDLSDCANDWDMLIIEKDLVTALAGSIDNVLILVDVWDPWRVKLDCAN